jgi:hypothetical protein
MMSLSHVLARWNLHFCTVGVFDQHAILIAPTVILRMPFAYYGAEGERERPSSPSDFKFGHNPEGTSARIGAPMNTISPQAKWPPMTPNR